MDRSVLVFEDFERERFCFLSRFGLRIVEGARGEPIPGSYWGEPEAGLLGDELHVRADTPVHSLLHEASHYVCMTAARRASLARDAGSEDLEEAAVCYFQILLAEHIPGAGREHIFHDMDLWGYSFRRGTTRLWFEGDAEDARAWLVRHGLVDPRGEILWSLRADSLHNE